MIFAGAYIGSNAVSKVYLGADELWSALDPFIQNLIDEIDERLVGKSVEVTGYFYDNYFSSWPTSFAGSRNPNCWCNDVSNISCIGAWGTYEYNLRIVTLIAPDIGISARHIGSGAGIAIGSSCLFVAPDGSEHWLEIEDKRQIGSSDIDIIKFTTSAPEEIGIAKVLSDVNYAKLVAHVTSGGVRVPAIFSDQEAKAIVVDVDYAEETPQTARVQAPITAKRLEFYEPAGSGDSGHPDGVISEGEFAILFTFHFSTRGPSVHYYRDEINEAITDLGSIHRLYEVGEEADDDTGGAFLDLAWANGSGLPGLLGFKLNESADGETGWTVAKTFADPDAISGELANRDYNQLRYFYLSAYSASLESAVTGVLGRYTIPPHVPANPQAVADGYYAINLSIDAPATEPIGGVHVWRDAGSGYELNDTWPPGVHSGTDDSLVSGASYSYKFSAFNQNPDATYAETAFSNVATESTVAFDYIYASDLAEADEYTPDFTVNSGSPVFSDGELAINGGELVLNFAVIGEPDESTVCLFLGLTPVPANSWVIAFGSMVASFTENNIALSSGGSASQALPSGTITAYAARYLWLTYVKGTGGGNGTFEVIVSTSQTKPTPDATNSCSVAATGISADVEYIYFQGTVNLTKIRVANTVLGSYPV